MGINWNRGLNKSLRIMGQPWTTEIDGDSNSFHGIFSTVDGYEDGQAGTPSKLITVTTLTVRSDVAARFAFNQVLTDECGKKWYATQKLKQDDGLITEVKLVEQPE